MRTKNLDLIMQIDCRQTQKFSAYLRQEKIMVLSIHIA